MFCSCDEVGCSFGLFSFLKLFLEFCERYLTFVFVSLFEVVYVCLL